MTINVLKAPPLFFLIFLLANYLCLLACEDGLEDHEGQGSQTIRIDLNAAKLGQLSDIYESLEYIPLSSQWNYANVFNDFLQLKIFGNHLYLYQDGDTYGNIYRFSLDGTQSELYALPTEGVGRVSNVSDFLVQPDKNELLLIDSYQKEAIRYDLDSKSHLTSQSISDRFRKVQMLGDRYVFYSRNMLSSSSVESSQHNLYLSDGNFEIIDSAWTIPPYLENYRIKQYNFSNEQNGKVLFMNFLSKDIYAITKEGFSIPFQLDFGKEWVDKRVVERLSADPDRAVRRQLLYNNTDHIYTLNHLFQTHRQLIFTFYYQNELHWVIYDLETKETVVYNQWENNLDGGPIGNKLYWPYVLHDKSIYYLLPKEDISASLKAGNSRFQAKLLQLQQDPRWPSAEAVLVRAQLKYY